MPRSKSGTTARGRSRGKPIASRTGKAQAAHLDFRPPQTRNDTESQHFSLQDEARNTDRHHSFWTSDVKLRHTRVNFVSAGNLEGSKKQDLQDEQETSAQKTILESEAALADMALDDSPERSGSHSTRQERAQSSSRNAEHLESPLQDPPSPGLSHSHFFIDTKGSNIQTQPALPPPTIRHPSPSPSSSSGEVIVFTGRNGRGRGGPGQAEAEAQSSRQTSVTPQRVSELGDSPEEAFDSAQSMSEKPQPETHEASTRIIEEPSYTVQTTTISTRAQSRKSGAPKERKPRHRSIRRGPVDLTKHDEEALLAEYIANMREKSVSEESDCETLAPGLGGNAASSSSSVYPSLDSEMRDGWDISAIQDLGDMSTSDEVLDSIQAILSKRHRPHGLQYLVVWEGYTVDDAKWISSSLLTMSGAAEVIARFEENEKEIAEYPGDASDSTESELDGDSDPGTDDLEEDLKDDADLLMRKAVRMTDERMARLLAKQEELGMGADELLLFDDDEDDDDDDEDDEDRDRRPRSTPKLKGRAAQNKRPKGDLASVAFLAEQYENFDIMDWDRTSLVKKPKGQKPALPFDVSDSELEAALLSSWASDRNKKSARKREREELRAQGLLGKKNKHKANMKAKYAEGMTMDDIKDEIKQFLMSTHESLALLPMGKFERKTVHEIANAFNLKSKSVGGGESRFPTLYKTNRSVTYDESSLPALEARLNQRRRFLPRLDKKGKGSGAPRRRGGAGGAGVAYRDGEVVGAAAPELGIENRGRAMLEKMGWSTGTALGALDNKGILQPVSHVIKISKAGLG